MALLLSSRDEATSEQEKLDLLAIDALRSSSVQELKEQGNAYLKQGKSHYKDALDCYTRAINLKVDNAADNSILYANRSQANRLMGNNRRALNDAEEAMKLNPSNIKAYFRAAKAAIALDLLEDAARFCLDGLTVEPSNNELKALRKQVEDRFAALTEQKQKSKELVSVLKERNVRLGRHLYRELCGGPKPWLDLSNILHWPVLLLYGEVMVSDFIEDFSELDRFHLHLDEMYGGGCPLQWDTRHEYTRDRIELYYRSNALPPLSDRGMQKLIAEDVVDEDEQAYGKAPAWVKVDEKSSLRDVLAKPDFVIPGIPVFYVVSRGSNFRELFLSGQWSPP